MKVLSSCSGQHEAQVSSVDTLVPLGCHGYVDISHLPSAIALLGNGMALFTSVCSTDVIDVVAG